MIDPMLQEARTANILRLAQVYATLGESAAADSCIRDANDLVWDELPDQDQYATAGDFLEDADPASDEFAEQVEDLAARLWDADPGKRTAARTFDEDYGSTQDRYRAMATTILDPTTGEDHQR